MRGLLLAFLLLFGVSINAEPVVAPAYGECRDHLNRPVRFIGVPHRIFRMANPRSVFASTMGRNIVMYDRDSLSRFPHQFSQLVLWHECGHYALGHLSRSAYSKSVRVRRDRENDADCYSGEAMRRIGYSEEDMRIAIETLANIGMGQDITHQNASARADVVYQCYHK